MANKSPIPLTAHQTMVRAALLGMFKASPVLDRFCSWMLGLGGLTLGLLISNLDSVQPHLHVQAIQGFTWVFLLSFLFGFLEKLLAAMIESGIASAEEVEAALLQLMSGEVEVVDAPFDPEQVAKEMISSVWYPMRWLAALGARKGTKDPIWGVKYTVKLLQVQFMLMIGQTCLTVAAVIVLIGAL